MLIHKDGIKWMQGEIARFQSLLDQYSIYESINNQANWSNESRTFVTYFQSKVNSYSTNSIEDRGYKRFNKDNVEKDISNPNTTAINTSANFFILLNEFTNQVCNHLTHEDNFRNFMKQFSIIDVNDPADIADSKRQVRNELHELSSNFYALSKCMDEAIILNKSLNKAINLSKDFQEIDRFSKQISQMQKLINNIDSSSRVMGSEINNISKLKPVDRNIVPKPELPDYGSSWTYSNILSWI